MGFVGEEGVQVVRGEAVVAEEDVGFVEVSGGDDRAGFEVDFDFGVSGVGHGLGEVAHWDGAVLFCGHCGGVLQ